ncbi:MAG: RHS domain-containing protein [Deltaproteobacteria bacterium]|nr:RHS domain-containing protein [Deltaproteobacteria bacterium]
MKKRSLLFFLFAYLFFAANASDSLAAMGGPDSYGYSWVDSNAPSPSIAYNWMDISATGTVAISSCDDCSENVPIGFNFIYYGNTFSSININSNGSLSLDGSFNQYSNRPVPNSAFPNNIIAPFWDDLYISSPALVHYQTSGTAPNRIFTVQWSQARFYNPRAASLTFQALFHENGNILFQYNSMSGGAWNGGSATIGIENSDGTVGLQYSYNSAVISPGLAISFSRSLEVGSTYPPNDATGVKLNSNILATFNTPLDTSLISNSSVTVVGSLSGQMEGVISYIPFSNTIEFNPSVDFLPDETITVTLNPGLANTLGKVLSSEYSWTFVAGNVSDGVAPLPVEGLVVSDVPYDSGGAIDILWSPVTADDLLYYRIYRGETVLENVQGLTPVGITDGGSFVDDSAVDGVEYYYAVTAVDSSGNEVSVVQSAGPVSSADDPPHVPTGLSADLAGTGVSLYWNSNTEADFAGYKIYYGTLSGSYEVALDVGSSISYELSGLQSCTNYYIAISAYDLAGNESSLSPEAVVNSGNPGNPTAPTGLSVSAGNGLATISWNANPECDVNSYYVYRRASGETGYEYLGIVYGVSNTTFTDSKVVNGMTYYYAVVAKDTFNYTSLYSNEVSVIAVDTTAPSQPTNVSGYQTNSGIGIQWYQGYAPDIAGYKVSYGTSSGNYAQTLNWSYASAGWRSYNLSGLTDCTDYYIAVSSYDLSGNESLLSGELVYNSGQAGNPSAPMGLGILSEESKISVTWASNPECDIKDYYVYRRAGTLGNYQYMGTVSETTYIDTKLVHGTTYYYKVVARDGTNNTSGYSQEVSAVAIDTTSPAPPSGIYVQSSNGTDYLYINWNNNTENDIGSYKIYYGTSSGEYLQSVTTGTQSYFYLSGLPGCIPHYIVVTALDLSGNESSYSQEKTGMVALSSTLQAPTGLTASSAESVITLNWTPNTECDVQGYKVFRSTASGSGYQNIAYVTSGTSYEDKNLAHGASYYYTIKAANWNGLESSYSSEASAVAIDTTPPQKPSWVNASAGENHVNVSWSASPSPDIKEYTVSYGTLSGSYESSTVTANLSATLSGLSSCTTYYVAVKASDLSNLLSSYSNEVSVKTFLSGTPSSPTGLAGEGGNNSVHLSWAANSECDIKEYRIYRKSSPGGSFQHVATTSNVTYTDANLASEATYYYHVKAVDISGLVGSASLEISATTQDTTPPAIPVLTPGLWLFTAESVFTLSGTKEANSSIKINGAEVVALNQSTDWTAGVTLTETNNTFSITSVDPSGNECQPLSVTVVRDTVPPFISGSVPSNNQSTMQEVTAVTITLSDSGSGVMIGSSQTDALVKNSQNVDIPGAWSTAGNDQIIFTPSVPMPEEVYTITIQPVDNLGNRGVSTLVFAVDQTPPPPPEISTFSSLSNASAQTILGTKSTDSSAVIVKVNDTVMSQGSTTYPDSTSWRAVISGFVEGANIVTAIAKDSAGNLSESVFVEIVYDTTPPSVPAVNPVASTTRDSLITLTGSKDAGSYLYVNSVKTSADFSIDTWEYNKSLVEGINNISFYAKDEAGNQSQTVAVQVTRDTTGPVISSSTPSKNISTNSAGTIEITLSDAYSSVDLQGSLAGALVKNNEGSEKEGTWTVSGDNIIFSPQPALTDNIYTVIIHPIDVLGNTGAASFSFTLDTTKPVAQSLSMNPSSPHRAENVSFTVTFNENMNTGVKPGLVFTKGLFSSNHTVSSGYWIDSRRWRGTYTLTSTMGDGTYTLTVSDAKDKAGNVINSKDMGIFILDTTSPETPLINTVTTPTKTATQIISGTKPEGTSLIVNNVKRINHNQEATWSYSYPLKEGANNINVRARDEAGNDSTAATTSITLDSTPPLFTIDVYSARSASETQTISGKKEPGCVVMLNGELLFDETDVESTWSYTITLVEGLSNHLAFTATDALGNRVSKSIDIVYDLSAPSPLAVGVLAADGSGRGDTIKLDWNAYSEPADLAYYRIYRSSESISDVTGMDAEATTNRGEKTYVFTGLTEGSTYYFAVEPVDMSENSRTDVNDASGVPVDALAPENVTVKSVTAGYNVTLGNWIKVEWNASADSWGDLTGYTVYFDNGAGYDGGTKLANSTLSFTKSGLEDATAYKFKITTEDDLGNVSGGTVTSGVTRLDNPVGLTATPKNAKVILNWDAITSPHLKYYVIYRLASSGQQTDIGGMTQVGSTAGTGFTDTGVVNGTTYQYAVTSLNNYGAEKTTVASISAKPREDDVPPVVDSINLTENHVITANKTITATAVDSESPVEKMDIYIDGVLATTVTGASLSYAWNVIAVADGNHAIRVVAYDKFNNAGEVTRNVVVRLAPPSKPTITGHTVVTTAPEYKVNVSCSAPADTMVTFYLNGIAIATKERVSGLTFSGIVLNEGDNLLTAKASHRGGESAYSNLYTVTVDTGAPSAPAGLTAKALAGGALQFTWQAGAGEVPTEYNLYGGSTVFASSSDAGVAKVNTASIKYLFSEHIPLDDSLRYYAVTALDSAGNESGISNVISIASDRSAPSLNSVTFKYTDNNGSVLDPVSVAGAGTVNVAVSVSETLSEVPFFSLEPQDGSPVVVSLKNESENRWTGSFSVNYLSPHGPTTYKFSGKDLVGNRGNNSGTGIRIDMKGPVATILSPTALLQKISNPVTVNVQFDEAPVGIPQMQFRDTEGMTAEIAGLAHGGDGKTFTGNVNVSSLADGDATFILVEARDNFNNKSTKVTSGEKILLYTDSVPAPPAPSGLTARTITGGEVKLSWSGVAYKYQEPSYKLYRAGDGETVPTLIYSGTLLTYSDVPPQDGSYVYSVAAVGLLNSEGEKSAGVNGLSDRTAPPVPTGLVLNLDGNGVNAFWEGVQVAGDIPVEVPKYYRLYRSGGNIVSISGLSEIATVITTTATDSSPATSKRFYAVTALDALGNESAPSQTVEISFPVAPVKNLYMKRIDGGAPVITWEAPEPGLQGYYIYRDDIKITPVPVQVAGYTDASYEEGMTRTYGVSSISSLGTESPIKEVTASPFHIGLPEGTLIKQGVLERVPVLLTNSGNADIEVKKITIKVGSSSASTLNGPYQLAAGGSITVEKVAAAAYSSQPTIAVAASAIWQPSPGVTVEVSETSLAGVAPGGALLEIFNEPLVRGTDASITLRVHNKGSARMEFLTSQNNGPTNHVAVYLKDEDGNVLASGRLDQRTGGVVNSSGYASARLEPGESITTDPIIFKVPSSAPFKVYLEAVISNTYYHYGQSDQVTAPGIKQLTETTISNTTYRAEASLAQDFYVKAQPVLITGQAINNLSGEPMPFVPVNLYISVKGYDRHYTVNTNSEGSFSYTFQPGSNEAGNYSVWANHPDIADRNIQATFTIADMSVGPRYASIKLTKGKTYDIPVTIYNKGETPLTGLTLSTAASPGITARALTDGRTTISGGERYSVRFRLTAALDAPDSATASLDISTAEGLTGKVSASVALINAIPVIRTSPSYIDTGMVRGGQQVKTFTISNTGGDVLRNGRIEGPSKSWISLTTGRVIPDLAPGESYEVGLIIRPEETIGQGVYNDSIRIVADNHIPYSYNLQVTVVTDAVGNVQFDVLNELLADVSGASIRFQHQQLSELIYTVTTAADGTATKYDLPEGRYTFSITAPGHKSFSGSFVIEPGVTRIVPIALEVTLVEVEWSVVPTEIVDKYEIKISQTFETEVPVPLLITEPASLTLPELQPGEVFNGEYTVTNYGLIGVTEVNINFPRTIGGEYDIEILTTIPDSIDAMQKITIPYRISRREAAPDTVASLDNGTAYACSDSLYDEVSGFGGSCGESFSITVSGSTIICPGALNESKVTKSTTFYGSIPKSCGDGGTGEADPFGVGGVSTYSGYGVGGGQSSGGEIIDGKVTTSLSGSSGDGGCIYPRSPEKPECPLGGSGGGSDDPCDKCDTDKTCVTTGSAVSLGNGTYQFEETDLRIPARAIPIEWSRTYRSNMIMHNGTNWVFSAPMDGPLGYGWSSSYTARAGAGSYMDGKGNYFTFDIADDGTYTAKKENGLSLRLTETGYEVTHFGGNTETFDSSGRLRTIKNIRGKTVTITYAEEEPQTMKWPMPLSVIDAVGREVLTFSYDTEGHITAVTDIAGRTVSYEYDESGNLTTAVLTAGDATPITLGSYTYDLTVYPVPPVKCSYKIVSHNPRVVIGTCQTGEQESATNNYHNMIGKTNAVGDTYTIAYNPKWRNKGIAQSITDPAGNTMSFEQNFTGGSFTYTDYSGRKKRKTLNSVGDLILEELIEEGKDPIILKKIEYLQNRVEKITDEVGNVRLLQRDEWGNVISRTDGEGNETTYTYDRDGNKLSETDPLGTITQYEYDEFGNRTKQIMAAGTSDEVVSIYAYNEWGEITSSTISDSITTYAYDDTGNMISMTDPLGNTTNMEYDDLGKMTMLIGPNGIRTEFTYDSLGNKKMETDPLGNETNYSYDLKNRLVNVTDSQGNETTYEYDFKDRLISVTDALNMSTTMSYDGAGNLVEMTNAKGNTIINTYDSSGRITSVTDAEGNIARYEYTSVGSECSSCYGGNKSIPGKMTDPLGNEIFHSFNMSGRLTVRSDAMGYNTSMLYDAVGRITAKTDAEGNITRYSYDALGRMIEEIDMEGGIITYTYDKRGNMTSLTDQAGNTTTFTYDLAGRKIKETRPMGQVTEYSYYLDGLLKMIKDPKGQVTRYSYDEVGRVIEVNYDDGKKDTFGYDAVGNMTSYSSAGISDTLTYDALGRKLSETVNYGDFSKTYSYTYDAVGNKESYTSPEGVAYTYSYNKINQIRAINFNNKTISYDYQWKRPVKKTLPNGFSSNYQYNANSWLVEHNVGNASGTLMNSQYTFDRVGNTLSVTSGGTSRSYSYDKIYQLTGAANPDLANESYVYDNIGNRLTLAVEGTVADDYSHNANNELLSSGDVVYSYDANGNTVSATKDGKTTNYVYDASNRLVRVELPDGGLATYAYDPFGRRVSKVVDGLTTFYFYSEEGLIGEYGPDGTLKKTYGWKPNMTWGTEPLFMIENGDYYYYHNDHIGTPQKMTDSGGNVVWGARYTAFGEAVIEQQSTIENNLRFPGQYFDEETGLHYNWMRYYDPVAGRYTQADPIGFEALDENLYRYVQNNSINYRDPLGLFLNAPKCWDVEEYNENSGWNDSVETDVTVATYFQLPRFIYEYGGPGVNNPFTAIKFPASPTINIKYQWYDIQLVTTKTYAVSQYMKWVTVVCEVEYYDECGNVQTDKTFEPNVPKHGEPLRNLISETSEWDTSYSHDNPYDSNVPIIP